MLRRVQVVVSIHHGQKLIGSFVKRFVGGLDISDELVDDALDPQASFVEGDRNQAVT